MASTARIARVAEHMCGAPAPAPCAGKAGGFKVSTRHCQTPLFHQRTIATENRYCDDDDGDGDVEDDGVLERLQVAAIGAGGGIGQPLALLLKLSPKISHLSLYDVVRTKGVGADLGHIDSPVAIYVGGTVNLLTSPPLCC